MKKIIDIHSHMLPGVDDGCKTKEEARKMLKMYEDQNVETVICTPHFGPCGIPDADVNDAFRWLRSTSKNVNLYLGNEILISSTTLRDVRSGKAHRLNGSKWILIEFEEWGAYSAGADEILAAMQWIAKSEYNIILAHPERYKNLQLNHEIYRKIAKAGVKLQINAYDICQNTNRETVEAARFLLDNRLVSFIGSDAHGAEKRSPELAKGVEWIYEHCPEDYADVIVHDNAAKIIKDGGD